MVLVRHSFLYNFPWLQVKSVNVTSAQNTSLVVSVQPCNEYSFQVEFSQESFWRSKIHKYKSGVTKFKTQGIPTIKPTFDWQVKSILNRLDFVRIIMSDSGI